jgi:micrococcal nuclease
MGVYTYRAELVRMIDGDTIELYIDLGFHVTVREKVRLNRINAPEKRGKYLTREDRKKGKESTDYLVHLLDTYSPFTIVTMRDKQGKYGRYLVDIVGSNGEDINAMMVTDGHAVYTDY